MMKKSNQKRQIVLDNMLTKCQRPEQKRDDDVQFLCEVPAKLKQQTINSMLVKLERPKEQVRDTESLWIVPHKKADQKITSFFSPK